MAALRPRVPSIVGPIILIGVGIVALLMVTGHIAASEVLGLVRPLVAAAADRRGPCAAGRVGAGHAPRDPGAARRQLCRHPDPAGHPGVWRRGWNHMGPWFNDWDDETEDFFNMFGLPEHDIDQQVLSAQFQPMP